ncbi:MMPL family transporter [Nocardia sp. NPDC049149]|uniref:MMPL family transporter n=1 Tax=Nocardia sp. NPDC049149 TaxID=3364315 RepID=UPI003712B5E0
MFTRWGDLVFRLRFAVIGIVAAALLALGGYGLGLGDHLSSSGWDDPTSESSRGAKIADASFGRDHSSDVIVLYTAPEGKTIDDPDFKEKVLESLNRLPEQYPEISKINGAYWPTKTGQSSPIVFGSKDKKYTFASIAIKGDNDTEMLNNFRKVKGVFGIPGVDVQVAGLQAVAGTLNDTMAEDQHRMEILAIPAVAVLLFFIFGGLVAAGLPLVVGGLTVIGAQGIVLFITRFTEVNSFVAPVVSMIGLGLAIDYGLFIVSRFREELAEGYSTPAAVRRSVMTAGRTVVFSATMIIASLGGMLLFPQGFLKSIAYGSIATVSLAALTSITILPAILGVLGPKVDMLGLKKFRKTQTAEQVENGFWGNITRWVMRHPLKIAIPICIGLLLLIIPVKNLAFGGINERYLPPDNSTRLAQAKFDSIFPLRKSDPIQLVFVAENSNDVGKVWKEANNAPGLAGSFEVPSRSTNDPTVFRTSATLADSEDADPTIDYLRSVDIPDGVTMYVGGQPVIQKDSIDALLDRMPWMIALVLFVTTLLMFLTFGSLVLPIKAALMSALGLGSTLGILTWIFVDGHAAQTLNFTPQPIMSPVLVLIIAVIYGLSTDYEVFLLSRMVEARTQGASTTEAVRIGTAQTGRIITAAALILLVVTGAFAFSDLVMMQYLAYGMIAALFIDATILRMLLVPATMKLLGDDCWWAPAWMKKIQEKIGLGEPILDDERPGGGELVDLVKTTPITDPVTMQIPAIADANRPRKPRRPRTVEEIEAEAPTKHLKKVPKAPKAPTTPAPAPLDPTRQRPTPPSSFVSDPGMQRPSFPATPHDPTGPRPTPTEPPAPRPFSATPHDPTGPRPTPAESSAPRPFPAIPHDPTGPRPTPAESSAPRPFSATPHDPTGPRPTPTESSAPRPFSATPHDPTGPRPTPPAHTDLSSGAPFEAFAEPPATAFESPAGAFEPPAGAFEPPAARPFEPIAGGFQPRPFEPLAGTFEPPAAAPSAPQPAPPAVAFDPTRRPEAKFEPTQPTPSVAPFGVADPTPAPTYTEFTPPDQVPADQPTHHAAPDPSPADSTDSDEGEPNRNSIENWMAELRSSRRAGKPDEGRHSGGDGRTVSVNELLRRRDRE